MALFFLPYSTGLWAQFTGGGGGGYENLATGLSCSFFFGGQGQGYDTAQVRDPAWVCGGLFVGDSSSGYAQALFQDSLSCLFFRGLGGQGYATEQKDASLACLSFYGSNRGGYAQRAYSDDQGACAVLVLPIAASPLFIRNLDDKRAQLYWQTFSERDNEGFELYKSLDGQNWDLIAWLAGQGYSNQIIDYQYLDPNAQASLQYYRYRQIDFSGQETWSNTVVLQRNPSQVQPEPRQWVLYPNPARAEASLNVQVWHLGQSSLKTDFRLFDPMGRLHGYFQHQVSEGSSLSLPLQGLSSGLYYLQIISEDGQMQTLALVIR